ncbi:MAG TPA: hypothetical protein VGF55_02225 [Gemmataceae bacterium]|jgi:hypothetical protein
MSQHKTAAAKTTDLDSDDLRSTDLRASPMMARLLDALEGGQDVGHYGRLVFVMVARHFLDEDELVRLLADQPDQDEAKARALVLQVKAKRYSPPKRERVLEWQAQQDFPICPSEDPDAGNVYRDLKFPDEVYEHIGEYYEEKADAQ